MTFYHENVVNKVRGARSHGLSVNQLEQKFNIPGTTISRWVRDIRLTNPHSKKAEEKIVSNKAVYKSLSQKFPLNPESAKLLASLLYWCEGAKYPSTGYVAFANSDWRLLKTFLELLRLGFNIQDDRLRAHLQIHSTQDYQKQLSFWSQLLKIPSTQFYKPTVTHPTHSMKRRDYKGTCTVKYYNVELLLQMTGMYETFAEKW